MDDDLAAALEYAGNDAKTDRRMFVSGINCSKFRAYEQMMAVKCRFGERGINVAYHGYQSFQVGEVTPEEAHAIGVETARRMWGGRYQVLVTTHLNTKNLHNHFVVNSVSFVDGTKFRNKIGDHLELRKASDAICREHGKSALKSSSFYGKGKTEYWPRQKGGLTHRDILRRDIDEAIANSPDREKFEKHLKGLGYRFIRDMDYAHVSITAPGWKRPVRLDSLGKDYTPERIAERIAENYNDFSLYRIPPYKPKRRPLLELEIAYRHAGRMDGVQLTFAIFIELLKLILGYQDMQVTTQPLSPALRQEVRKLDEIIKQYEFLRKNNLNTLEDLALFIEATENTIAELEKRRQQEYNRCRRPRSEADKAAHQAGARKISVWLKPQRADLAMSKKIAERYPLILELLEVERSMEENVKIKQKERGYER